MYSLVFGGIYFQDQGQVGVVCFFYFKANYVVNAAKYYWLVGGHINRIPLAQIFVQTLPTEYLSYENFNFEMKKGGAHTH